MDKEALKISYGERDRLVSKIADLKIEYNNNLIVKVFYEKIKNKNSPWVKIIEGVKNE